MFLAGAVVVGQARRTPDPAPSTPSSATPNGTDPGVDAPVEIEATSTVHLTTLAELTEASDLVVRGTVEQTSRGRVVGGGDPRASDANGVVSRIVTLRVDEVLEGAGAQPGDKVLVEEEGWLTDGRPIAVNGAAPTAKGDAGIWFLQSVRDPELTGYVATNGQGRFLVKPGDASVLVGGDTKDPLVQQLAALTPEALADGVRRHAAPP